MSPRLRTNRMSLATRNSHDVNHEATKPRAAPRIGFNHNIRYRGKIYHVQTEDSGRSKRHIFTHVFFAGHVIASRKVEYGFEEDDDGAAARVVRLMQESHKSMVLCLCTGALDERIQASVGAPSPLSDEQRAKLERIQRLKETIDMATVSDSLKRLQTEISGFHAAALVDHESGMCLGTIGNGINIEVAAAGNTDVVRAKMRVMSELGIKGGIEDMLITLQDQYHIIRPVGDALFLYLAFDRSQGNLAMARHKMGAIGSEIVV